MQIGQYNAQFASPKIGIGATDDPPTATAYEIPADFDYFALVKR